MTARGVLGDVLLSGATCFVLLATIGVVVLRDAAQKLHFTPLGATIAPVFVALAVLVAAGWSEATAMTWCTVGFMVATSPFLSHATMRAVRVREAGDWRPGGEVRSASAGEEDDA